MIWTRPALEEIPTNPKYHSEIVRRNDGTFDLFVNDELDRTNIAEKWLNEEVFVRFGFCAEEYDSMVRILFSDGRARVVF